MNTVTPITNYPRMDSNSSSLSSAQQEQQKAYANLVLPSTSMPQTAPMNHTPTTAYPPQQQAMVNYMSNMHPYPHPMNMIPSLLQQPMPQSQTIPILTNGNAQQ